MSNKKINVRVPDKRKKTAAKADEARVHEYDRPRFESGSKVHKLKTKYINEQGNTVHIIKHND